MLTVLACLERHGGSPWCFQFLSSILDGFFEFLVLRVNEINSSLFCSFAHFCFHLSLPFLLSFVQSSGHKQSGLDVSCFLVSLHPDHFYPSGGFSSHRVNCLKPVEGSDKSLEPSIFQWSSMRRSCITSKFVRVVLDTSMYFSGIGNDSSLG